MFLLTDDLKIESGNMLNNGFNYLKCPVYKKTISSIHLIFVLLKKITLGVSLFNFYDKSIDKEVYIALSVCIMIRSSRGH